MDLSGIYIGIRVVEGDYEYQFSSMLTHFLRHSVKVLATASNIRSHTSDILLYCRSIQHIESVEESAKVEDSINISVEKVTKSHDMTKIVNLRSGFRYSEQR